MRKILLIIFTLLLSACSNNTISDNSVLYMESISEGNIYSYLSEDLKKEFKLINDNKEICIERHRQGFKRHYCN